MEKLVALVNIQYKGKLYIPGEEISDPEPEMAEAWKRAGSVKVLGGADKEIPEESNETESGVEPDIEKPPKEGKKGK